MSVPGSLSDYLRQFGAELGERILQTYPALYKPGDPVSPGMRTLLRKPYPAQEVAAMSVVRRWQEARAAAVIAECGTGKTLVALAAVHCHADGRPYTALALVPGHLTAKMAREAFLTLPGVRVFFIDALRDRPRDGSPCGVNEVKLRHSKIVREGLHTTLTDLRLRKKYKTARERWQKEMCAGPALMIVGRDRSKLGWFWRHAHTMARSGPCLGSTVNPDTGRPVYVGENRLVASDFGKARISEIVSMTGEEGSPDAKPRRCLYSPLWEADRNRIRRVAPLEFIGRYLPDWFDYGIGDEVHQLAGDTAQGNALGTLANCVDRIVVLTGTLSGGYADDLHKVLFRLNPGKMAGRGYDWGESGRRAFAETYGVLEKITTIEPADNVCSKARITNQVKRRPGASPLLFGDFLMEMAAFISLEDIACDLPSYTEEVMGIEMDPPLRAAYSKLEDEVKNALKEHRGNHSVLSAGLNALLMYPDRPYDVGDLYGWDYNPENERRERFLIARTEDLDRECFQAKERRLIEIVKAELKTNRRCHVYAVYTQKRDVTRRLEAILAREGVRVAVLTADVPTDRREAWFERKLHEGVQVTICHPKIIETGLDLLSHSSLIFYQSGYSLHTLRQASRRSWRIGQRQPVRVYYLHYKETMQSSCLRLMAKKMLVSLAMEGKFSVGEGLHSLEEDDDILTAMARELVTKQGIGESAEAAWRQLQAEHSRGVPPPAIEPTVPDVDIALPPPAVLPLPVGVSALKFGVRPPQSPSRKQESTPPTEREQFSLF
ncbi:MAG TPA: helicase-related protein [Terriglobales bacterium]|nr:helicase-related protein [Terriglobales bacterium]